MSLCLAVRESAGFIMIKNFLLVGQHTSDLGFDTQWSVFMPDKLFKQNHI